MPHVYLSPRAEEGKQVSELRTSAAAPLGSLRRDTSRFRTRSSRRAVRERLLPAQMLQVRSQPRSGRVAESYRSSPIARHAPLRKNSSSLFGSFAVRTTPRARVQLSLLSFNIMLCSRFVRHASQKISTWLQYVHLCFCLLRPHSRRVEFAAARLRLPHKRSNESIGTLNA
jgi:hypothetical protein